MLCYDDAPCSTVIKASLPSKTPMAGLEKSPKQIRVLYPPVRMLQVLDQQETRNNTFVAPDFTRHPSPPSVKLNKLHDPRHIFSNITNTSD